MFVEEKSLYRRFTRLWFIMASAGAVAIGYRLMSKTLDDSAPSVFGYCTYANMLFLLAWGLNFGITMWVSFVAGPVMLKTLERRVFTEVQARLFPFYFLIQGLASLVQLAFVLYVKQITSAAITYQEKFVIGAMDAGLLSGFLNGVWLGPKTTEIVLKKRDMEKEEGVSPPNIGPKLKENAKYRALNKKFGIYHGVSVLLNLFSLAGSFYIMYFLAFDLVKSGRAAGS